MKTAETVFAALKRRWSAEMSDLPVYTAGRLSAVLTRPLLLFLTNNYLGQRAAQGLAIVFLANALGLSAVAADPHRRFYARHFGASRQLNAYPFVIYLASLDLLLLLGITVVGSIAFTFSRSVALTGAAILYFSSEKLADELLRFRLFEKRFEVWGWSNIVRSVLQISAFVAVLLVYGLGTSLWLPVIAFSIGNVVVFVPQIPAAFWRLFRPARFQRWIAYRAMRVIAGDFILWVLALLTSGLAYLDRSLAALVARDMLPQFTLASMCLSSVQLMIDFFYVSRHRRAFLEGHITVQGIARGIEFPLILLAGVTIGLAACFTTLHYSSRGGELPVAYIAAICVIQVSLALIGGMREIPYWHGAIRSLVAIEAGFYVVFSIAVMAAAWWLHLTPPHIFYAAAGCVLLRLAAYTWLSATAGRQKADTRDVLHASDPVVQLAGAPAASID